MKKLFLIVLMILLTGCTKNQSFELAQVLHERPEKTGVIFDYTGLMRVSEESITAYLQNIRDKYRIECLIVTLPSLDEHYTVGRAAVELFSNWKIGQSYQGRGILLLLVDDIKQIKLEISYELEDVFTDLFTGHIENLQLQPHFSAGQLEIGLVAVMEEIEARAQIKFKGQYTAAAIADLDSKYLSQGAGAEIVLEPATPQVDFSGAVDNRYPAGRTPGEFWETMIKRWRDKERSPNLGIYLPTGRLTGRDFTNQPDSFFEKNYRMYANKSYQVLEDGDFAVIYFGKKSGWDNAPFLLCRTREGWQFDLVHQRRFVRRGPAPDWGVEFSEHPHMKLLMDTFGYDGQDIPVEGADRYTIDQDAGLADQILALERSHQSDPDDFDSLVSLGRLYVLASMPLKAMAILNGAKKIRLVDPRPYKYLAIAHVDAFYQYDSAIKELTGYIERAPEDQFGYSFLGYLYYRRQKYEKAAEMFEKALALKPDNCYAHYYLSHVYAGRFNKAFKLDPRRYDYLRRHNYHVAQTRSYQKSRPLRVQRLNKWLEK